MEVYALRWFSVYYFVLAMLLLLLGLRWILRPQPFSDSLVNPEKGEQSPRAPIQALKYFLLFTVPGLFLSFFPFSWPELLFSLWSLLVVYLLGSMLLRWKQIRPFLVEQKNRLPKYVRRTGVILLALAVLMFLLFYRKLNQTSLL